MADAIYLDWNATTPLHPTVVEAMEAAREHVWANPASVHRAGRAARDLLEGAREVIGAALGFEPRDVLFTGSGTEANNLALHDAGALVTSRIEHRSVVALAEQLEQRGVPVVWVPVGESGALEPASIDESLARLGQQATGVVRVAVMAANHETGVLQPLGEIAEVVHRHDALLHVDAVQLFGRGALDLLAGADSVAVAAHKLRGPKGIGAYLTRPGRVPRPLLRGGSQERGLRPGTLDAGAAIGFRAAVERLGESQAAYAQLAPLRQRLDAELAPFARRNGAGERLPHVTNLSFDGWRGDELVAALDLHGVLVSSGSACSAGTTEASPVITAVTGKERAASAVRISLGEETTALEMERALEVFRVILGASAQSHLA